MADSINDATPKVEDEVEMWRRELTEAGWTRLRSTLWRSPSGELFLGPYGAWTVMKRGRDA